VPVGAGRKLVALGLMAIAMLGAVACGDDDDSDSDSSAPAVAPSPDEAFRGFSAALEAEGLVVSDLPKNELQGAEAGRQVTGDKSGTALLFKSEDEAKAYADGVSGDEKTNTVGTVVFTASTQEDADFFAEAYEGG
jgi:hypothetical protein